MAEKQAGVFLGGTGLVICRWTRGTLAGQALLCPLQAEFTAPCSSGCWKATLGGAGSRGLLPAAQSEPEATEVRPRDLSSRLSFRGPSEPASDLLEICITSLPMSTARKRTGLQPLASWRNTGQRRNFFSFLKLGLSSTVQQTTWAGLSGRSQMAESRRSIRKDRQQSTARLGILLRKGQVEGPGWAPNLCCGIRRSPRSQSYLHVNQASGSKVEQNQREHSDCPLCFTCSLEAV